MQIEVFINEKSQILQHGSTLAQIIVLLKLPVLGCVFAINDSIIAKSQWSSYQLNNGDKISLFQAIAGG